MCGEHSCQHWDLKIRDNFSLPAFCRPSPFFSPPDSHPLYRCPLQALPPPRLKCLLLTFMPKCADNFKLHKYLTIHLSCNYRSTHTRMHKSVQVHRNTNYELSFTGTLRQTDKHQHTNTHTHTHTHHCTYSTET